MHLAVLYTVPDLFFILLLITFNITNYFTFKITFTIFNSQYILITCKPDLILYRALLFVYNTV